jgi:plasmid stabilization system protein ParE
MMYQIDVSSVASSEADQAALTVARLLGAERSKEWYDGLLTAIASLKQMPKRCAVAREDEFLSLEVRQLLYGKGRSTYRIVFTILDGPGVATVRILSIRHSSQLPMGQPEDQKA